MIFERFLKSNQIKGNRFYLFKYNSIKVFQSSDLYFRMFQFQELKFRIGSKT